MDHTSLADLRKTEMALLWSPYAAAVARLRLPVSASDAVRGVVAQLAAGGPRWWVRTRAADLQKATSPQSVLFAGFHLHRTARHLCVREKKNLRQKHVQLKFTTETYEKCTPRWRHRQYQ